MTLPNEKYDYDYYERGQASGKSCYSNYRWMPKETFDMCESIIEHAGIAHGDKILDFGCAKGFIVKAFHQMGYASQGCDLSKYAISNADPEIKDLVYLYDSEKQNIDKDYNIIISKDVLEHVSYEELPKILNLFRANCDKLFIVVPLGTAGKYIVPEYELDITHVIRENKAWWENQFLQAGFKIYKSAYLMAGIKDNWAHYSQGNGFFVLR